MLDYLECVYGPHEPLGLPIDGYWKLVNRLRAVHAKQAVCGPFRMVVADYIIRLPAGDRDAAMVKIVAILGTADAGGLT